MTGDCVIWTETAAAAAAAAAAKIIQERVYATLPDISSLQLFLVLGRGGKMEAMGPPNFSKHPQRDLSRSCPEMQQILQQSEWRTAPVILDQCKYE